MSNTDSVCGAHVGPELDKACPVDKSCGKEQVCADCCDDHCADCCGLHHGHARGNHIPLIGEKLPKMQVVTTHGPKTIPCDYAGKWLVLFSHPADFTPVCTTEFVAFQKLYPKFRELNCELLGLSVDQVFAHIKWEEWIKEHFDVEIEFPIIADTGAVAQKLGFIHPGGSGQDTNTVRAVFVIDPEGKVRTILYYPQELGRLMDEIVRIVEGLQTVDAHKVALPANWPNNDLFGEDVIVPPARDVKSAKERFAKAEAGEFVCEDWWLCHKKLDK